MEELVENAGGHQVKYFDRVRAQEKERISQIGQSLQSKAELLHLQQKPHFSGSLNPALKANLQYFFSA